MTGRHSAAESACEPLDPGKGTRRGTRGVFKRVLNGFKRQLATTLTL